MIGWEDIYKVVVSMVPLYVALILGYGSVRWWHIFTPDQCEAINRLVCYFTLPLFTFEFAATVNPFEMNYLFIAADAISKVVVVAVVGFWAKCSSKGSSNSYSWCITSFCLSTLNNYLVVGVPLMKTMYGQMGVDLAIQASVVQNLLWLTFLLFVLELRRSRSIDYHQSSAEKIVRDSPVLSPVHDHQGTDLEENNNNTNTNNNNNNNNNSSSNNTNNYYNSMVISNTALRPPSFWSLMKVVWIKLAMNPNSYACILGIFWASISNKWHFQMPSIVEGSILIMSRAGTGTAMFSMGLFTGLQEKAIACGASLTVFGVVLRFIAGPASMAIGAIAVGLRGNILRVAIIQAAMPQSIASFVFAKQYGLHADVISTAVIFGTMVSLPVLIAYYAALESLNC